LVGEFEVCLALELSTWRWAASGVGVGAGCWWVVHFAEEGGVLVRYSERASGEITEQRARGERATGEIRERDHYCDYCIVVTVDFE